MIGSWGDAPGSYEKAPLALKKYEARGANDTLNTFFLSAQPRWFCWVNVQ